MSCRNPIIIGGSGSSGSSLLATILNRHPEVAVGPELSLFNKPVLYENDWDEFSKNLKKYIHKGSSTKGWFLYWKSMRKIEEYGWEIESLIKMSLSCKNNVEFVDNFFDKFLKNNNKTIWAEKTPSNSYYFKSFLKLYPQGRIIHIYRDYKDVVASFQKRGMTAYYSSMLYLYNTASALSCRASKNYYELSYEDLVKNPSDSIKAICDFLNLKYDESMLSSNNENVSRKLRSWNNDPSSKISTSSIGKGRTDLSKYNYFVFDHIRISKSHLIKHNLNFDNMKDVVKLINYNYQKKSYPTHLRFCYMIKLLLSMITDNLKRIAVMIYIDKKIHSLPGKIKVW